MLVFAVQLDIAWHDKPANHARVNLLLDQAGVTPGALVVLPEMFSTGFSMAVDQTADDVTHESEDFLLKTAEERGVAIIGGLTVRGADGRGRNQALVAFPDRQPPLRYEKMQPFTLGGEGEHFTAGSDIVLFEWQGLKIAPFICYDLRFPELFRAAVLRGAQVLAVIANWPVVREDHWMTLLRARAIENLCYAVGVNRAGRDANHAYGGRSVFLGPRGGAIAEAGDRETVIAGQLNAAALNDWRRKFPALGDIRADYVVDPTCGAPPRTSPP